MIHIINYISTGPPVISSTVIIFDHVVTMSVLFYSSTEATYTWTHLNKKIVNSSERVQILGKRQVKVNFYNKSIDCDGYVVNISMSPATAGQYMIHLKNDIGETARTLNLKLTNTQGNVNLNKYGL